ncbi:hypothetical protein LCGC14_0478850 [marine sediment metagenome]|uniref:peptidyl-tRNA hydrolase n=1 Tax=marine sediment metagenome TaxID=412755 RepID=A0A0F9UX17_9ZZZZ
MEIKNPYNDPASVKARKEQEDPWVMYCIVKHSLGMSVGKTAAQVGHAIGILYGEYHRIQDNLRDALDDTTGYARQPSDLSIEHMAQLIKSTNFYDWKKDSFRKIVLKAKDTQWDNLKEKLECYIVRDAGLTEIEAGSETVIGLWPCRRSQAPNIVKKLQCLK